MTLGQRDHRHVPLDVILLQRHVAGAPARNQQRAVALFRRPADKGMLLEDAQAVVTCPAVLLGEAGDTAYRLNIATERSQKLETQLPVREAATGTREEEKEGGKGTQESRNHRDAPGAGDCRAAGQDVAVRGNTVTWRAPSVPGEAVE
jgi:hypothetical protein